MEPQPGSPASPSSPGTSSSSGTAKATASFGETPASPSSPGTPSSSGSAKATTLCEETPTSPSSPGTPWSDSANATTPFGPMPALDEPKDEAAALDQGRYSTSSSSSSSSSSSAGSLFHLDAADLGSTLVSAMPENKQTAPPVESALVKPDEWATWSEEKPRAVDSSSSSDSGGTGPMTEAPLVQTMPELDSAAAALAGGGGGFDPDRIPTSVFQPRTSVSQAEWSVTSNESLFNIHGTSQSDDLGGLYAGSSRSHFDYFYDEAMASAGAEQDSKLPPVAEGTEPGVAKQLTVPGSAGSEASDGSAGAKKADVLRALRRHESDSGGSSSNFSFAFPILAETSPKEKDCVTAALYQPLQKEYEPPMSQPPVASPASAFVEMTTEEERRRSNGWCCCGCCWFDCSAWSSCCCCRWWARGCCQCFVPQPLPVQLVPLLPRELAGKLTK